MVLSDQELLIDISERLHAMQESSSRYVIPDYISTEWQQKLKDSISTDVRGEYEVSQQSSDGAPAAQADNIGRNDTTESAVSSSHKMNEHWREKICEWKYNVVDCFNLDREVVSISMFFLDKYLEKHFVNEEVSLLHNVVHSLHLTLQSIFLTLRLIQRTVP